MRRMFPIVVLGCVIPASLATIIANSQISESQSGLTPVRASIDLPALPPAPGGRSTALGGEIVKVDPVRDELTLRVAAQRQMKVLFDERTQVFRDGVRISPRELGLADHASVQTMLDGTDVYALSIHMLSKSPEGEYQGRVLNYNPATSELTLSSTLSRDPLKLAVPLSTQITRVGQLGHLSSQPGLSDLVSGALISVSFQPDAKGHAIASEIAILATPGSEFVFSGSLSVLDVGAGVLILVDPRDEKSYQVSFDAAHLPAIRRLQLQDHIQVTAKFDGTRYIASSVAAD